MAGVNVLAVNAGSSSVKVRLFEVARDSPLEPPQALAGGDSLEAVLQSVDRSRIRAVGHRVVHGGATFREPVRITTSVKTEIRRLAEFAPEHNCLEADLMDQVEDALGAAVPQIAVFDTAFHTTLPPAAYVYPGPRAWLDMGIRRYGFHGISHQYVAARAAEILGHPLDKLKLITAHLGNGASLAAIRDGKCIDTTMGFTPLDGLMMGTRSGSIDPGIPIHLLRRHGMPPDELDRVLNDDSGLKGLSGISGDMREIERAIDAGEASARLAFEVYIHRLVRETGAMAASLGGADAIVFTGGVGENSARVRDAATSRLAFLNARILVIRTAEEWSIARQCARLLP